MGLCWHNDWHEFYECDKCNDNVSIDFPHGIPMQVNFSTWQGFGLLWEWSNKQEWFWLFTCKQMFSENSDAPFEKCDDDGNFHKGIIHPSRFADALYEFLKNHHRG
jgi:hypothetical protein